MSDWMEWTKRISDAGSVGYTITTMEEVAQHLEEQAKLAEQIEAGIQGDGIDQMIHRSAYHLTAKNLRAIESEINRVRQLKIREAMKFANRLSPPTEQ